MIHSIFVMPAQAGIQKIKNFVIASECRERGNPEKNLKTSGLLRCAMHSSQRQLSWMPACAGMTIFALLLSQTILAQSVQQNKAEKPVTLETIPLAASVTQNQKISLDFQNIPVRDVLQILASFIQQNVILSDSIKGNITVTLKEVPWQQALHFILQSQGLAEHHLGDVLIIAPSAELANQEQTTLTDEQRLADLAPLKMESFAINYGKVDDYYALLQDPKQTLLSKRGHVVKLNNSNTLIVEDTAQKLGTIAKLFQKMDVPNRQVLIEARIVYVNTNYQRNLGVNWSSLTTGSTTPAGNGFNMDLAPAGLGSAGNNIGNLSVGTLLSGTNLGLQLLAIETEGAGEVVSSPRILTANNTAGSIEQGQQIPYQTQAASGGTTYQFVQALLKLQVTPQITPNNKLLLDILITQDSAGAIPLNGGPPPINTRKLTTMIMVNNDQTIVLGGIYDKTKTSTVLRLPWLSRIPLIGNLFKSKSTVDSKDELLIFLTPKIMEKDNDHSLE